MGHERVGRLPRTQRWVSIVATVSQVPPSEPQVQGIASATLDAVRERFSRIERDKGVQSAFRFLTGLAQYPEITRPEGISKPVPGEAPVRIVLQLNKFVDANRDSGEYAAIAKQAGADAIAGWMRRGTDQPQLFDESVAPRNAWAEAANGAAFSEVSRLFFASFTERYVKYFLDREASAALPSVEDRERFSSLVSEQVDRISKHAFETSKITQSFAAGWYNKNARGTVPTNQQVQGFLAIAFGKIREELRRESSL
jgi:hypothetical protein